MVVKERERKQEERRKKEKNRKKRKRERKFEREREMNIYGEYLISQDSERVREMWEGELGEREKRESERFKCSTRNNRWKPFWNKINCAQIIHLSWKSSSCHSADPFDYECKIFLLGRDLFTERRPRVYYSNNRVADCKVFFWFTLW